MKYAVTSDIHFGHKNTPTEHIIASLRKHLLTPANHSLDVLFFAGDVFDHLLYLNTREAQLVMQFFHQLLTYCNTHDIALRVLEGTPSHDWYQSSILAKMNEVRKAPADLRYVRALEIEHLERIGKHILYIPDEWCSEQDELDRQLRAQFTQHGIDKVDLCILHGAFRYQAQGKPVGGFLYEEQQFLDFTRGYIHIGHYHTHTHLDRIIAQGSFERLAHGEEGDKGYVLVEGDRWQFVPNPDAYCYKTLPIRSSTDLQKLDRAMLKLPVGAHVRLEMRADHPFNAAFKDLLLRYPDHHLKKKVKGEDSESEAVPYITAEAELIHPEQFMLETNVYDTLMHLVRAKHTLTPRETDKVERYAQCLRVVEPSPEETPP